jgi:hypothetical protein
MGTGPPVGRPINIEVSMKLEELIYTDHLIQFIDSSGIRGLRS